MILKGANLGNVETDFANLSTYNWFDDKELNDCVLYLEKLYFSLCEKSKEFPCKSMLLDTNGLVDIKPNLINHRCSSELDALKNISLYGVLASEWFGILESEREGCFCVFVTRMKNKSYPYRGDLGEDNHSRLNVGRNVILFFDETNPVMQYLIHLDYFEYAKIKKESPELITKKYTKDEILLLDKLIGPLSLAGNDMRKNYDFKTNYWSAIPGGIPSYLINGVCIKNNNYTDEELNEISSYFPNAIIFNAKKEILRCQNLNTEIKKYK